MTQSSARTFLLVCGLTALLPAAILAQQFPLELRVQQDENLFTVANGTQLQIGADAVDTATSIRIDAIYRGDSKAVFSAQPELLGSTAFSVDDLDELPVELGPNETLSLAVRFAPTSASTAAAQFALVFLEEESSIGEPVVGQIRFGLTGVVPDITVNYALAVDANIIPLENGGAVEFEPTRVNTVAIATVLIANQGSGSGPIESIRVTGDAFAPVGIPLLPATIGSGGSVQFQIRYSPEEIGKDMGSLEVGLGSDTAFAAALVGSAVGSSFTYELLSADQTNAITPETAVPVPPTRVGDSSTATIKVNNTGSADGEINVIGVSGPGFSVADLPFLPALVRPNESLAFTLNFEPSEAGDIAGRMRIGEAIFDLLGSALGPRLTYEYLLGGESVTADPGDSVIFSPVAVGAQAAATFTVRNEGEEPATIASIGVVAVEDAFALRRAPRLPMTLNPGGSTSFEIIFSPADKGLVSGQLVVDQTIFPLSGFGEEARPLPGFRFTGVVGVVEPAQQVAVGLELEEPYPIDLTGSLGIEVNAGELVDDPSIQFALGGRQAAFEIPANTTVARFGSGARSIQLQTGTVAGDIEIQPLFLTEEGLDLTPGEPESLRLLVAPAPPTLLSVQARALGANTLAMTLVGFTTTRSLTRADFTFASAPNAEITASQFSIDLGANSRFWFESIASRAFGGLFSVTIPFTLSGGGSNMDPVRAIGVVSTLVANDLGESEVLAATVFQQP